LAAGGLLQGDDRGFSADPTKSSRVVLAWNTATGQVTLKVSHSTIVSLNDNKIASTTPRAALPITATDMTQAFAVRDQARSANPSAIDTSAPAGALHARLSVVNSLTNGWAVGPINVGAWSSDAELTITRTGPGIYQATQLTGNGYPAIEAYYYPHTNVDEISG